MKIMQVLTASLFATIAQSAQQIDQAILGHARYGLVFANSRGICDEYDPLFNGTPREQKFGRHKINAIKEMEKLHFVGHGLVHTRVKHDTVPIHKKNPFLKATRGCLEAGSLSSAQYNVLMGIITTNLGAIGQHVGAYEPEVRQFWTDVSKKFQVFLRPGQAGQIVARELEVVLPVSTLMGHARFAVLLKLTRGVCAELTEVEKWDATKQPRNIERAFMDLKFLGNKLCHNICRPAARISTPYDGCTDAQIDEQVYNFFMLTIRDYLNTLRKDRKLSVYMNNTLQFMRDLPANLQIKREYSNVPTFVRHADNKDHCFNIKRGRFPKKRMKQYLAKEKTPQQKAAILARQQSRKAKEIRLAALASSPKGKAVKDNGIFDSSKSSDESSSSAESVSEKSCSKSKELDINSSGAEKLVYSSGDEKLYSSGDEKPGYSSGSETLSSSGLLVSPRGKNTSNPTDVNILLTQLAKSGI